MPLMEKVAQCKWPITLALIGVALNVAVVVSFIWGLRDSGISFVGPGETTVTIPKPGDYTLWNQSKTFIDSQLRTFPDDLPSGTTIQVMKLPEGTLVPMHGGVSSMESQSGGTRRVSVGQITFQSPGQYKVAVSGLAEQRAFYLDQGNFQRFFLSVMLLGSAGMLFMFAGIGWGLYVLAQTSKRPRAGADTPDRSGVAIERAQPGVALFAREPCDHRYERIARSDAGNKLPESAVVVGDSSRLVRSSVVRHGFSDARPYVHWFSCRGGSWDDLCFCRLYLLHAAVQDQLRRSVSGNAGILPAGSSVERYFMHPQVGWMPVLRRQGAGSGRILRLAVSVLAQAARESQAVD